MSEPVYHIPALLPQAIESLDIEPNGIYVDVTYGGGGHSAAIASRLSGKGRLYALDQDEEALERAVVDDNVTLIHGNFRYLANYLDFYGVETVDGILGDLGVSFHHFDDPSRGFSFRWDGELDMRMNRRSNITAARILDSYPENRLADMFYLYGDLRNSRRIAAAIVKARANSPITTVESFLNILRPHIDPRQEKKELAQAFQALRIEVNCEADALRSLLKDATQVLRPGGRLAIITYHSLEDRLVKNFMKTGNFEGKVEKDFFGRINTPLKLLNSKPIIPDENEITANPRSRSAKLRVAVKL